MRYPPPGNGPIVDGPALLVFRLIDTASKRGAGGTVMGVVACARSDTASIVRTAIDTARVRDERLGVTSEEHVRPWIQAFSLGKPAYGPEQIKEQKQAIYDAGYDGWVLWSAGSHFDPFIPALEKETVSRKKK